MLKDLWQDWVHDTRRFWGTLPDALRAGWRSALLAWALCTVAAVVLLWPSFESMVGIWARSDTFAHGYLVFPAVLWLIWRRRYDCLVMQPRPWWPGLVLLALLVPGWLIVRLAHVNAAEHFAIVAVLVLLVPVVFGRAIGLRLLFPLCFSFFAVPFGEFLLPTLMNSTADFTVAALRASGIPVYREGLEFVIPSGHWSVVEACSGIRYLIASFMVGTLFAYINYRGAGRRVVFGVVSLIVPLVANWLRAYMIVMIGHLSGNELATGVDHIIYGWIFFGLVMTLLYMVGIRYVDAPLVEPQPAVPASPPAPRAPWPQVALTVTLLALPAGWAQHVEHLAGASAPVVLSPLDLSAEGWTRLDSPTKSGWKPAYGGASAQEHACYLKGGRSFCVWVLFYRGQDEERKVMNSENRLAGFKDDWVVVPASAGAGSTGQPPVWQASGLRQRLHVSGPREELQVLQTHWIDGTFTNSAVHARLLTAWCRLAGRVDNAAAVFIYAPAAEEGAPGLAELMPAVTPAIQGYLQSQSQR